MPLTNVFWVLLFTFFFLLYRDSVQSFFYKAFADTKRTIINTVFQSIYTVVKDYLAGLVLVILIIGSIMTAGLFFFGVDYAVFFGFLGACLVLIPYFGIALGSLLPAAYTLVTQDNPQKALAVIGLFLGVQMIEGNFITPYVLGSKVSINPLTAILKVIFDSVESLNPYGFLIGKAEKPRLPINSLTELANQLPRSGRTWTP